MKEPKRIEQPHNDGNYYYAVQNRFDGRLHRDVSIHQPQQHTHYHENFDYLEQWHNLWPFFCGLRLTSVVRMSQGFQSRELSWSKSCSPEKSRQHTHEEY